MEKARTALESETDIIKMIRSRRFVHMALKQLLDPALRKDLKLKSQLKEIEIEEQNDPPLAADGEGASNQRGQQSNDYTSEWLSALPGEQNDHSIIVDYFEQ